RGRSMPSNITSPPKATVKGGFSSSASSSESFSSLVSSGATAPSSTSLWFSASGEEHEVRRARACVTEHARGGVGKRGGGVGETEGLPSLGRTPQVSGWLYSRLGHLVESSYYLTFGSSGGSSRLLRADVRRGGRRCRVAQDACPGFRPLDSFRNYTKGAKRT